MMNGLKLRTVKCGKCPCQVEPFEETINQTRDACGKKLGCGLHRFNSSLFPRSKERPIIHLPVLLDKKVVADPIRAIIEADCGDCCSHTPTEPMEDGEYYEIYEPTVVEIDWNPPRGRKGRRK